MLFDWTQFEVQLKKWQCWLEAAALPGWEDLPDLPLYMDQVILLLGQYLAVGGKEARGITPSIVNNYVRMKVMPAPVKKKYTRIHLAYLIMICTLKQSLSIACIQKMLPPDLSEEQVRGLYNIFVTHYREIALYFASQISNSSPPLFQLSEEEGNPAGSLAVGAPLMANLAQSLTEQIVLLHSAGDGGEGRHDKAKTEESK